MVTDPISDLLVRLQNGFRRRHDVVSVPASRLKREVLRILQNEGYIQGVQADIADGHPVLTRCMPVTIGWPSATYRNCTFSTGCPSAMSAWTP